MLTAAGYTKYDEYNHQYQRTSDPVKRKSNDALVLLRGRISSADVGHIALTHLRSQDTRLSILPASIHSFHAERKCWPLTIAVTLRVVPPTLLESVGEGVDILEPTRRFLQCLTAPARTPPSPASLVPCTPAEESNSSGPVPVPQITRSAATMGSPAPQRSSSKTWTLSWFMLRLAGRRYAGEDCALQQRAFARCEASSGLNLTPLEFDVKFYNWDINSDKSSIYYRAMSKTVRVPVQSDGRPLDFAKHDKASTHGCPLLL